MNNQPMEILLVEDNENDIITMPVDFDNLRDVVRQFAIYWALVARVPFPRR